MNICLLVSSMGAGGAERVAATLSNGWNDRGYKVTLIVTYSHRGDCAYYLDSNIELIYLADHVHGSNVDQPSKIRRFLVLRNIIKSRSPTVIVSFLTNVNVAAIVIARSLMCPIVVAERSYPPQMEIGWRLGLLRRLTYPFASRVIMLTDLGLEWLKTNIVAARGLVIPNPIAYPMANTAPILNPYDHFSIDRKLLVAAGRLAPEKQFDHIIRAFAGLARNNVDWDFAIVGAGPLLSNLQLLVASYGLGDRIKFVGRAGNIGNWYERADIYVLCSRFEGFPNSLAEAMAYGCAVISYDCDTGPRDIISAGVNGILIPPGDEGALAAAVSNLMADEPTRLRMSNSAKSVRDQYGLRNVLDQWDAVFANV